MGQRRQHRWGRGVIGGAVLGAVAVMAAACTPASSTPTVQEQLDDIVRFVETSRGHEFVTAPVVTFVSDSVFRQDILDAVAEAKPSVDAAEPTFKALGWMASGASLWELYQRAFRGGVVGYYDPASKVLKVRGSGLTPYRRQVIAHELTHALDDQVFGLDDEAGDNLLDEPTFASLVAIEGDAARIEQRYFNAMSALDRAQDTIEQLSAGSDPALLTVPLALLTFIQVPYLRGPKFVGDVATSGGTPAVDGIFARYPSTAEQAFDAAKYLADEPAVAVAAPPADGPVVASGTWGQFLLSEILRSGSALAMDPATQGWAGDAYVTWGSGASSCLRLDTRMDTQPQADALRSSLTSWAASHSGAIVAAQGPATVRLTTCA